MVFVAPLLAGVCVAVAFAVPNLGMNDQAGLAVAGIFGVLLALPLSYLGARQIKARFK